MKSTTGRRTLRGAFALALATALLMAASPAAAHVSFFVGGVVGFPAYPAPYYPYYPSPYVYPYPAPFPYFEDVPPPGWVAGQWEVRSDPWGRAVRVWVPGHLR